MRMQSEITNERPTKNPLLIGVLALLFVGIVKGALVRIGMDKDVCDLILVSLALAFLFILFREPLQSRCVSFVPLLCGLAGGFAYYYVFYLGESIVVHSTNGALGVVIYLFNSVVVIPIFEEKVARQLLLFGLAAYVNIWISAILVSLMFGLTHQGSVVFAFLFSIAMCALSIKRINTFNRSLLHGGFNLALNGTWIYVALSGV